MDAPRLDDGWDLMQKPKTDIGFIGRKRDQSLWKEVSSSILKMKLKFRPDIAFATSTVAQSSENPGWIHWEAVKRIFPLSFGH